MKVCGIPVVLDPALPRLAVARGLWPFKRIEVGPAWFALTPEERIAVLYHEAGHCKAWHMELRALLLPLLFITPQRHQRWCREQEFFCDRFAAALGWGWPLAVTLCRTRVPDHPLYPSNAERVARLKEYLCKP